VSNRQILGPTTAAEYIPTKQAEIRLVPKYGTGQPESDIVVEFWQPNFAGIRHPRHISNFTINSKFFGQSMSRTIIPILRKQYIRRMSMETAY
jgi:hypothetical protein